MTQNDPQNLKRFVLAQANDYEFALVELNHGRKETHWIWYIFPQVSGLGYSSMAQKYAICDRTQAIAYLDHPVLGERLHECCEALLAHENSDIVSVMGSPDDLKLRSSMTLFAAVSAEPSIYQTVLDRFYGGLSDEKTIDFLKSTSCE